MSMFRKPWAKLTSYSVHINIQGQGASLPPSPLLPQDKVSDQFLGHEIPA